MAGRREVSSGPPCPPPHLASPPSVTEGLPRSKAQRGQLCKAKRSALSVCDAMNTSPFQKILPHSLCGRPPRRTGAEHRAATLCPDSHVPVWGTIFAVEQGQRGFRASGMSASGIALLWQRTLPPARPL